MERVLRFVQGCRLTSRTHICRMIVSNMHEQFNCGGAHFRKGPAMASEELEVSEREFRWWVNTAGYQWLAATPQRWSVPHRRPVPMLTRADVSADALHLALRKYAPLRECPALF